MKIDDSGCGTLAYIGIALTLLIMAIVILLHYRKSKFCRGHRFSNIVKNSIVHLRCTALYTNKTLQDIRKSSLIQNHRHINIRRYKTKQKLLVDTLEIKWDKIKLVFNSNEINLPKLITIKIKNKIRVRRMMSREMQNFHIMVKQGMTWYNLESV